MTIITYQVTLDEPVLVTALAGDPNTSTSFDYLPGSVLRGAVISAYLRQNGLELLSDADPDIQRLFLNGQTQYLNGYPIDREGQRSLPCPLSWQQEKKEQQTETPQSPKPALDFAYEMPEPDPEKQWKGVKGPFFTIVGDKIRWVSVAKVLAVHTQRDPQKGRATRERGAVYQYEALAPGQTFVAMIVCHQDDAATLTNLLQGTHNIGGSRGAGYGRVTIDPGKITKTAVREMPGELAMARNGRFLVTCLSDLLLQDAYGQFQADPELLKAALEKRLGCPLSWFDSKRPTAFINGVHVGGFNRKWGLPLPQAKAISMGSVFVFAPPNGVTRDQLQEIEAQGLGLRRAEGFGRIAFNWQTEGEWAVEAPPSPQQSEIITLKNDTPEGQLLQTMVNRLFCQQLEAQLVVQADKWATKLPVQNSQLSRLRQVVQDELQKRPLTDDDPAKETTMEQGKERLLGYVARLEERATTRRQFDRARIGGRPLLTWFRERLEAKPDSIESLLSPALSPAIGETSGQWTAVMRYEYNLRLIDLTLAYCLKKGKEG